MLSLSLLSLSLSLSLSPLLLLLRSATMGLLVETILVIRDVWRLAVVIVVVLMTIIIITPRGSGGARRAAMLRPKHKTGWEMYNGNAFTITTKLIASPEITSPAKPLLAAICPRFTIQRH